MGYPEDKQPDGFPFSIGLRIHNDIPIPGIAGWGAPGFDGDYRPDDPLLIRAARSFFPGPALTGSFFSK